MHLLILKRLHHLLAILSLLLMAAEPLRAQSCSTPTITTDKTSICNGESTTLLLSPEPSYNVSSYQWYVDEDGDGTFDPVVGAREKSYAVGTAGTYRLEITSGACGTQVSNNIKINVTERPSTPVISINPPSGAICGGDEVTFTVQSPEPGVDYVWRVDGADPKSGTEVQYTFESFGTGSEFFNITVEAIRQPGSCRTEDDITIEVRQTPEVDFGEESDFTVCLPDSVEPADTTVVAKLINNIQEPYLSNIAAYNIDWGDGNGEVRYPGGDPALFPEEGPAYEEFGTYPIRIRVEATNGCEAIFEREFFYGQDPTANFTTGKEAVSTPQSCTPVIWAFGDSSSGGGLTYKWEIKDQMNIGGWEVQLGESLTEDTLRVQFNNSGQFEVQLIVSNACTSDTTSQSIIVGYPQAQLSGGFTACGDTTIKYDQTQVFFDPNFGNTVSYEWFVNGQQVSTEQYPSIDFPSPGTYNVEVRITNECGSSDDLGQQAPPQVVTILPIPGPPVISPTITTCSGDSALLAPTGPGTMYNFYDNGGNLLFTGAEYKTGALTGPTTFQIETVDGNNCPSERVTVNVNVVPSIGNNTIEGNQSICVGDTPAPLAGSRPTGGAGGSYVYTWQVSTTGPSSGFVKATGTSNDQDYAPQSVGQTSWYRRIVNSGSCTADTSQAVKVTVVPRIENNTIEGDQEICANQAAATITGDRPTGGDGTNYTIIWEVSTEGPAEGFVPAPGDNAGENYEPGVLTQDSWFRRVVESGGCRVASEPVKVTVYDELANNAIQADQEVCTGAVPAILTGSEPTGGSGSYVYTWESSTVGPNSGFAPATGSNRSQNYSPGRLSRTTWYRRTVSSAACEAILSNVVQVTVNPGVRNNTIVATQSTVCTGQVPGPISGSTPTDGAGGYTYLWESSTIGPEGGFVQAAGNNDGQDYTPAALNRDTWFRRVVFSGGCSDTSDVVSITVLPIPNAPQVVASSTTACFGESATVAVQNPNGGEYRWYTSSTGGSPVFIGAEFTIDDVSQTTTYYVEAVNAQECASAARTPATVTVVRAEADAGEDVTIIQGRSAALRASGGTTYAWEPADGLSDPNIQNPVATPEQTTTYTVTVTTAEGCVDTASVTVEVVPAISIPNAFTPNGDQTNEVWNIGNKELYPDMRVEVFNRWGNKVFSSVGYGIPWDGTYNGEQLPVATYYYIIYLNRLTDEPISGNVTIIR